MAQRLPQMRQAVSGDGRRVEDRGMLSQVFVVVQFVVGARSDSRATCLPLSSASSRQISTRPAIAQRARGARAEGQTPHGRQPARQRRIAAERTEAAGVPEVR